MPITSGANSSTKVCGNGVARSNCMSALHSLKILEAALPSFICVWVVLRLVALVC